MRRIPKQLAAVSVINAWGKPDVPRSAANEPEKRRLRFRHFIDGSLALASLNHTCRDHCPDVSAALTTVAFDQSVLRWLGISVLIAESEGPAFISYKVARSRLNRLRFVTQDPERTLLPATYSSDGLRDAQKTAISDKRLQVHIPTF